jgi:hypothetical protein
MAKTKKKASAATSDAATVGYEAQLWQMADALRGSMDALLPKLISGELRVKDAERLVEGAS